MKALSIHQPWAWLIAHGIKDIENRNWSTTYRGKILIHASLTFDQKAYNFIKKNFNIPKSYEYERGGIVGIVEIVDCVSEHSSFWFNGKYGFVLKNSLSLSFIRHRGQQGFFDIPDHLIIPKLFAAS